MKPITWLWITGIGFLSGCGDRGTYSPSDSASLTAGNPWFHTTYQLVIVPTEHDPCEKPTQAASRWLAFTDESNYQYRLTSQTGTRTYEGTYTFDGSLLKLRLEMADTPTSIPETEAQVFRVRQCPDGPRLIRPLSQGVEIAFPTSHLPSSPQSASVSSMK
ncbi:hypothetical protein [Pontibacter sp. G13]|uniref:hypothetical protein n=1 Tax=Pontibacter sp. G13 TaxID=3074898 RepID=UPI002889ECE9|nr:hypothetical protein [Pontibacter sp. G13]WNJ19928.1 hypothetical protein RJD25_05545 [Pontibacter sp. G13]